MENRVFDPGDDKTQVIIAITIMVLAIIWQIPADAAEIVKMTISGFLGAAVGRSLK